MSDDSSVKGPGCALVQKIMARSFPAWKFHKCLIHGVSLELGLSEILFNAYCSVENRKASKLHRGASPFCHLIHLCFPLLLSHVSWI